MKFLDLLRRYQQLVTRPIAVILVLSIAFYPLIPWPQIKYVIMGLLGGIILKMIFEIETQMKKYNQETIDRIKAVQKIVHTPFPPHWNNFSDAQRDIILEIKELLDKEQDIHLDILGVSARYSWRMVEDEMGHIITTYENRKFEIDIFVTDEELLKKWNLISWISDLERTKTGIAEFKNTFKDEEQNGRLKIERHNYDSLPQWHGVMINKKILFIGRTKWILNADGTSKFQVGTCQYRKFEPNDKFDGEPRITMFNNWVERLKRRSSELEQL